MPTPPSARSTDPAVSRHTTTVQKAAVGMGAVFLLVGILGFVPGVTTHYNELTFAGHHSMAALFGIFDVSVLHNLVHLAFGIAGVALARTFIAARAYLVGGGAIYLVLFIYGLVIDRQSSMNFVPVNNADNWLHFGLAVAMIALGILLTRAHRSNVSGPANDPAPHPDTPPL